MNKKWSFKLKSSLLPPSIRNSRLVKSMSSSKHNIQQVPEHDFAPENESQSVVPMYTALNDRVVSTLSCSIPPPNPFQVALPDSPANSDMWHMIKRDLETKSMINFRLFADKMALKKLVYFGNYRKDYLFINNSATQEFPIIEVKSSLSHVKVEDEIAPLIESMVSSIGSSGALDGNWMPPLNSLESISTVKVANSTTSFYADFFAYVDELQAAAKADESLIPLLASLESISRIYIDPSETMLYGEFLAGVAEMEGLANQSTVFVPLLTTLDNCQNVGGPGGKQVSLCPIFESLEQFSKIFESNQTVAPFVVAPKPELKIQIVEGNKSCTDTTEEAAPTTSIGNSVSATTTSSTYLSQTISADTMSTLNETISMGNTLTDQTLPTCTLRNSFTPHHDQFQDVYEYLNRNGAPKANESSSTCCNVYSMGSATQIGTSHATSSTCLCNSSNAQSTCAPPNTLNTEGSNCCSTSGASLLPVDSDNSFINPTNPSNSLPQGREFFQAQAVGVRAYLTSVNDKLSHLIILKQRLHAYDEFLSRQSDI
uniref:Uncharacterized protein n=1 Tax=Rhabditophanes sp. KR3021 TaxID=114890 RepID=A0AC35TGE8_9BILA